MDNENKYSAQLQQARNEDIERQRGNEEQQEIQEASENPDWRPEGGVGNDKKYKISSIVGLLMIIVALIVDGVSFLLNIFIITVPIYWIVWAGAILGSYIWLKMSGISWSDAKGKRTMMMFGAATGIEFVPFLSTLPAWTVFVIGAIINDRIEGVVKDSPLAQKAVGVMAKRKKDEEKEEDALEKLNNKQNRTREENIKLVQAREVMRYGSIRTDETDPVLRAAFERVRRGEKEWDGTKGFRFNNTNYMTGTKIYMRKIGENKKPVKENNDVKQK